MSVLFHIISQNLFFIKFYTIPGVSHGALTCLPIFQRFVKEEIILMVIHPHYNRFQVYATVPYPLLTSFE